MAWARAVAVDEVTLAAGPSDDGDRHGEPRCGGHVAARDRDPRALGERLHRLHELDRLGLPERRRHPQRHVRLTGLGAHRGEVGQGSRERLMTHVAG